MSLLRATSAAGRGVTRIPVPERRPAMPRHQLAAETDLRLQHQIEVLARETDQLADQAALAGHPAASVLSACGTDLERILGLTDAMRRGATVGRFAAMPIHPRRRGQAGAPRIT